MDSDGNPIVNGFIYIGEKNLDPTVLANQKTIYSDRELTTAISNPQRTDSFGRSVNKIWVSGQYAIEVQDVDSVQKLIDLDAGQETSSGITNLANVQGTNTITAEAVPNITALTDKELYIFRVANTNTGALTLQIDSTAAKAIKKNFDEAVVSGEFDANAVIIVQYNSTSDVFEWVNQKSAQPNKGVDIASASPLVIGTDGDLFDVTGTTNFAAMTVAANRRFQLQFDGILTITDGASIIFGDGDFTTEAGDILDCFSIATDTVLITGIKRAAGLGKVRNAVSASKTDTASTTSTTLVDISGLSVSITPKSTTSKILVIADIKGSANGTAALFSIIRDSTAIYKGDTAGSRKVGSGTFSTPDLDTICSTSAKFLDSPASVSALTYKIQWSTNGSGVYLNRSQTDTDGTSWGRVASSITVIEIGA